MSSTEPSPSKILEMLDVNQGQKRKTSNMDM